MRFEAEQKNLRVHVLLLIAGRQRDCPPPPDTVENGIPVLALWYLEKSLDLPENGPSFERLRQIAKPL
jgi:hypothetical protein